MLGAIPTIEAIEIARQADMDLVEVAPDERPPVCRIMDYGKFKYEQNKKKKDTHRPKQIQIKEIRLHPKTDVHDIDFKVKQARGFLEEGDNVKVNVMFKGREMAHVDRVREMVNGIITSLEDIAKVERFPIMEGRSMTAILTKK